MHFLQVEPIYIVSLEEILWGGLLVAISISMHGFGMLWVLRVNHTIKLKIHAKKGLVFGLLPVIFAGCMIMLVHLSEVVVWGMFFYWKSNFPSRSLSFYFSLNEYTTVDSSNQNFIKNY
jgi:hypothetical protein